jgi:DNA-directed RNA polymerase beta subunit
LYYDYLGQGKLPYGTNIILAMGMFAGYNQEDGIVINHDALQRGLFNSIHYRSYTVFEEDDEMAAFKGRQLNVGDQSDGENEDYHDEDFDDSKAASLVASVKDDWQAKYRQLEADHKDQAKTVNFQKAKIAALQTELEETLQ